MDRMLTTVAKLAGSSSRNDDDVVDRLHNRYTVLFLVIFAVVVSTNQYVGTPISCWAPAYFTDNHQRYADRVRFCRAMLCINPAYVVMRCLCFCLSVCLSVRHVRGLSQNE